MSIAPGEDIREDDFIKEADKNATPANDEGRVPQLENDGKVHPFFIRLGKQLNCGETINGATTPVPVYQNKTDNELYACDANDTAKMKFIGFVTTNGTDGNPARFQGAGVVSGFSGLDEGQKYYVSDTAGAISNAPGTQEILVGIAISTTELFICRGQRYAAGATSLSGVTTSTITTGFRASLVRIGASKDANTGGRAAMSVGQMTAAGNNCVYLWAFHADGTAGGSGERNDFCWWINDSQSGGTPTNIAAGVVDTITDTTFRLNQTSGNGTPGTVHVHWEAFGEL